MRLQARRAGCHIGHCLLLAAPPQLLSRAGACPSRSFLSASSVCANASLSMGPAQGSRWLLQRSTTTPGAFLIRFEVRGWWCSTAGDAVLPYQHRLCSHADRPRQAGEALTRSRRSHMLRPGCLQGRAGCPARFLGAVVPRGPAPACGDPGTNAARLPAPRCLQPAAPSACPLPCIEHSGRPCCRPAFVPQQWQPVSAAVLDSGLPPAATSQAPPAAAKA
jgi:hypothetical protein